MEYTKVEFSIQPLNTMAQEILIAELSQFAFDTFEETETGVIAYIPTQHIEEVDYEVISILKNPEFKINYQAENLPDKNWNEEWEKNFFKPIVIADQCIVRSPFHKVDKAYAHQILIEPKMAFGTGHHETTRLMMDYILKTELNNKNVLDMGCGTSLLAILTEQRGAKNIDAIDIDEWAYHNSLENIKLNNCKNISVKQGDATHIKGMFDIILANINRNILLADMATYSQHINTNGTIIISGFLVEDLEIITIEAEKSGLKLLSSQKYNRWMAAEFKKQ